MHSVTFSSIFGPQLSIKANLSPRINVKRVFKNFGMELYTPGTLQGLTDSVVFHTVLAKSQ